MVTLLAKSAEQGELTLLEHTRHVVQAVEVVAANVAPGQVAVARRGAVQHDLGKGHPFFQEALRPDFDRRRYREGVPHRHEISSLLFLPLFPRDEWPFLVDMVAGHHKSVQGCDADSRKHGRGLVDLVESYNEDPVFERHAEEWDRWSPLLDPVLAEFGIESRRLSLQEARTGFDFALDHCESKKKGWSRWRGILMSADHFASAMMHRTAEKGARLYQVPDLSYYERRAAAEGAALYPLTQVTAATDHRHTLVIAPTGAGKTDFLLRRCCSGGGRVFYTLPFQASINAMYKRLDRDLNGSDENRKAEDERTDIRRVHAASRIEIEDGREEEQILQRFPGAAIKVMTPHQAAAIVFGTSGHEAVALDLEGQDVILDEVHVYGDVAQAMVMEIVRALVRMNCRVHIGSATIPAELARKLIDVLGGEEAVYQVTLPDSVLETYNRHIVYKHETVESAQEVLRDALERGLRVLFVSNRVAAAQDRFRFIRENYPDVPSLLVHSRFRRCDRAELEQEIEVFDKRPGPCVVCATQVVEVSLDISFDCMITDAAPLDSLIQRFGRVNRRRLPPELRTLYPVHVIAPPEKDTDVRPYDAEVVRRSYAALPEGEVLQETALQGLINQIYPEVNVREIGQHLMVKEGVPQITELCHRPRSVLIDLLEIESASCIRRSDRDAYIKGRGNRRQQLEIPVSWKSIVSFTAQWERLEDIGNNPVVVPDEYYSMEWGLELPTRKEQSNADFTNRYL